jgi:hypothetical protein
MRLVRSLVALAVCVSALVAGTVDPAAAQFTIGGDPRVDPNDFRITGPRPASSCASPIPTTTASPMARGS